MSAESSKDDHRPGSADPAGESGPAGPPADSRAWTASPAQQPPAEVLSSEPASSRGSWASRRYAGRTSADHETAGSAGRRPGHAERWGAWAADPIRRARSIGPLSAFASLGPRLRSRRPVIIAGITVVGLLGGAGAALATTGSGTPSTAPSAVAATPSPGTAPAAGGPHRMFGHGFRGGSGPGFFGAGPGGPRFAGGVGLGALHGQFVIAKPGGGYRTVDIQSGAVTAVSATSIALRSSDGYSHTYALTSSTLIDAQRNGIGSVKVGHQVSLTATVSGSAATAMSVLDRTLLRQGRQAFGFGGNGGPSGSAPPSTQAG
jgi:hypothetical protein